MTKEKESSVGVVLYTDGGCRPNPGGNAGWGVHGYSYNLDECGDAVPGKSDAPTNEGYLHHTTPDTAVSAKPTAFYDGWSAIKGDTSNNIAELNGAIRGLAFAERVGAIKVRMILDSEYVLKGITSWRKGWERNGWVASTGKPVSNQTDWKLLFAAVDSALARGVVFDWQWTKGHKDNIGNVKADRNATRGVILSTKREFTPVEEFSEVERYWKSDIRPSRFYSHTHWYFLSNCGEHPTSRDGRWVYHCGVHDKQKVKQGTPKLVAQMREDELFGKASGENRYSVLFTREKDPVLESIRNYQDTVIKDTYSNVVIVKLATVFRADQYDSILKYGSEYLLPKRPANDIYASDEEMLTKEMRPPRLAYEAMDNLSLLERVLESYLEPGYSTDALDLVVTDVTEQFYDVETKKTKTVLKLKKHLAPGVKTIKFPVRYNVLGTEQEMKLQLSVGLHTPERNTLSALADEGVKVAVVTWRQSDAHFRHAFILETGVDVSIYAALHTNDVFVEV